MKTKEITSMLAHPTDLLRKLRRGQWIIQASLDLHGLTTDAAAAPGATETR